MTFTAEQIIITRLLSEVEGLQSLVLGQGIPQLLRPHLEDSCSLMSLEDIGAETESFDAIVVEAKQISHEGDICLFHEDRPLLKKVAGGRWIVATSHFDSRGEGKLVERLTEEVDCQGCAGLIITELGVIEVSVLGFELREVAPGRSSDDVRSAVRGSLHVADDLDLMKLDS